MEHFLRRKNADSLNRQSVVALEEACASSNAREVFLAPVNRKDRGPLLGHLVLHRCKTLGICSVTWPPLICNKGVCRNTLNEGSISPSFKVYQRMRPKNARKLASYGQESAKNLASSSFSRQDRGRTF